jgi:ABC-type multidrug transport system fused ATPase/permease subunit
MTGVEGIGEAMTGALAARSLEPAAGEPGEHRDGPCRNCGTPLVGEFCHRCGQTAHVHRTLGAFWHDLLHGVLHFEGKIWRTLPLLAWRPGELTRRYVEGERARFVSPLALFLFSVFLMFAVVSAIGGPFDTGVSMSARERAEAAREYQQEMAESEARLRELNQALGTAKAAGKATADIEREIQSERLQIRLQQDGYDLAMRLASEEEAREAAEQAEEEREEKQETAPAISKNGPTQSGWFNDAYLKAKKNPSLLFYKVQTNAYKFSWMLIPISVPFIWLLFLHRRRYRQYKAYDHVVFVTYSIAFMSLGFILLTLLRPLGLGDGVPATAIAFVPPLHMYRQLRGAYRLSRFSAIWRTIALLLFAAVASTLFLGLLMLLGVFG